MDLYGIFSVLDVDSFDTYLLLLILEQHTLL